ncbi:MAG: carbohydrate ABC transporter permease [Gemmatimonadales bacterium]
MRRRKGPGNPVDRERRKVLPMLLPALAVYGVFMFYPVITTVWVALTIWNVISTPAVVGMDNFVELLQDDRLRSAVVHTAQFVVLGGLILFPLAFYFAYTTEQIRFGKSYRFLILVPITLSVTTASLLWKFSLNPNFGFVNPLLRRLGLSDLGEMQWLGDTRTAMLMVVLATIWSGAGVWMLFLASAIAQVPPELREAAALDGASRTRIFWSIVMPLVWPVTRTLILLWIVQAAQAFGFILAMTNGGPLASTEVVGTYLYKVAFNDYRYGYASAIAVAVAILVLMVALAGRRLGRGAREAA